MEHLEGILKLVEAELDAINKNGKFKSREEIDSVYKLVDIAKDAYCIWNYEDEMDGESYDDGMSYRGRSMRSYDDGMSYARGRRNARRDSQGRYSRDGRSYRGNSYGYSRDGKDEYREQLMDMLDNAPDEATRQSIQRTIDNLK
jgi:hypothetical protein